MPSIFISYKKEDKSRVGPIVEGLRAEGLDVWWDQDIGPGQPWDETIKAHIEHARAIVAVWSTLSVTAPWVKEEAGIGKARGILLPVRIHDVDPPLGFGLIQATDLRYWKGDRTDPNWRTFIDRLNRIQRGEKLANLLAPQIGRRATTGLAAFALIALTALAALGVALWRPGHLAEASPAEQAAWVNAVKGKARPPYEAYLAAYPGGRFAGEAKAALATCRTSADVRTEPFERKVNVHGNTSAEAFGDRGAAIQSARDHGQEQADRVCAEIAESEKVERVNARVEPAGQPMCTQMGPKSVTCSQSLWATCKGEKRIETPKEVCG